MTTHNGSQLRTIARVGAMALVGASLVAACGSSKSSTTSGSGSSTGGAGDTITIKSYQFSQLTVKAGATVKVVNDDQAPHTVTDSDANGFNSGTIQGGDSGSFTAPTTPGSYSFICSIHPYMKGTLVVTAS